MRDASATAGGLFPPVQYSGVWGILALVIVVLIIAFYVIVPILLRERRADGPATDTSWMPGEASVELRERYLALLDEVEAAWSRQELSSRAAHQRLSLLLRYFAYESSGLRAPQMTLSDLRSAKAAPLGDAVERLYPGAFSVVEHGRVGESTTMAKEVVRSWG